MEDILTTRQVQEILKVDRITIYRMLQDGRLKGSKIGQQWRFARRDVERLLNKPAQQKEPESPVNNAMIPTHCIQTIQGLFSDVSGMSSLVVDVEGAPLTHPTNPCRFCQRMQQSPSGAEACRASWKHAAQQASAGSKFFTCHAGLQYIAAPVFDAGKPLGLFLTGHFHWQKPDLREEAERLRRLSATHNIPLNELQKAAAEIQVIKPEDQLQVESWPFSAARAVQSILKERIEFVDRLQQIANLTQIH